MKKLKAFSLLELTLSLSIIGLISTVLTSIYFLTNNLNKNNINERKFHYIRIAMQSYLLQKGKLPFASENEQGISSLNATKGLVPYKTLGIPKSFMYDSNKKPLIYVVNKLFTDTNIPLQIPLAYPPQKNEKSFLRLYKKEDETLYYDYYSKENELYILDEKDVSVIDSDDYFFVLTELKKPFKNRPELKEWIEINIKNNKEEYKVRNIVAWALIVESKNKEKNKERDEKNVFHVKNYTHIFFQTRFDMSAQIGFYCTSEPIYSD